MKTKLFIALFVFALAGASFAQTQFAVAVGDTDNDWGKSVVQTSDGGFVVAGETENFGAGYSDLFLVKFSSSGAVKWSRAVGGTVFDYGWSVVQTSDGGFAVAGLTRSFGAGDYDLFLVKFSSSGAVEWSRAVGGTDYDRGWSVVQTADGGFAVAGLTFSFGAGGDLFLVKFSSSGAVEWSRAVGGTYTDYGYSVVQTSDGGFAVAGWTESFGAGLDDLFLVKFSSAGDVEWFRAVGDMSYDYGYSVVQTSDGGFAIAGYTWRNFDVGSEDLFLVKFSSSGAVEWSRAVGGTYTDYGYSVVQTSDGGFAVAGLTRSFGAGTPDCSNLFLVKFTSAGAMEWSRAVGDTDWDQGYSVVQTSDGGFAVAGYTESFGAGSGGWGDLFLVKFDSEGNSCISEEVFPTVTDITDSISVASPSPSVASPSPIVTDVSPTVTITSPTVTEICTDDIKETMVGARLPRPYITVSPNPFNSSCEIIVDSPNAGQMKIYDVMGIEVASYNVDAGQSELIWKSDNSASGIYFVRLNAGDRTITKCAILIR